MRKLACPPAAGSASNHFSDADYKTKDVCDEHGQTVSIKMSFLVKDTVLRSFFPHMTMHLQTILRQGNVRYQRAERCVGSDEPKPG